MRGTAQFLFCLALLDIVLIFISAVDVVADDAVGINYGSDGQQHIDGGETEDAPHAHKGKKEFKRNSIETLELPDVDTAVEGVHDAVDVSALIVLRSGRRLPDRLPHDHRGDGVAGLEAEAVVVEVLELAVEVFAYL